MRKRFFWNSGKYLLGIGVLVYVVRRNWAHPQGSDGPGLADILAKPMQPVLLTLAVLLCLTALLLSFARWYVLVRAQNLPFTLLNAVRLGLIGFFLSTFLPGSIGGDVIKAACIAREQRRRTVAAGTVVMDRAVGLWSLTWLVALLGGSFCLFSHPVFAGGPPFQAVVLGAAAIVGISLTLWLLLGALGAAGAEGFAERLARIPTIGQAASELWRAVWMYRCRGRALLAALLLALASQSCLVAGFYFAAGIFQEPGRPPAIPSLAEHFLLVPIGEVIQTFFPAPGGVGGAEYGYAKLYLLAGSPEANGVLAALAYRTILWTLSLAGYFVSLGMRPGARPVPQKRITPEALSVGPVPGQLTPLTQS